MEFSYKRLNNGVSYIQKRELGLYLPKCFTNRFSASEVIMKQISLHRKLIGHEGCVNSIEFNSTGDLLVSGSDDTQVMFWDWETKRRKISYPSGHFGNIFQTRIMPFSDDRRIVTSAADGQVRLGQVLENGQVDTKELGKHQGNVYKLAVEPGSPHILYSCGGDGFVQHFDLRSWSATELFCCSSFAENSRQPPNSIRLNSIVIDPRNPNYFALGGSDAYARVYDMRKCRHDASIDSDAPVNTFCPHHLIGNRNLNITGLAYSNTSELLVSYNDELIYLFQKNMGIGSDPLSIYSEDLDKLEKPQVYSGHRNARTIKGVNFFGPNDEYVLSGSDCGHIFIWNKQSSKVLRLMPGDRHVVNQLEPHPHLPIFATCGIEKSVKLWVPIGGEAPPHTDVLEKVMESNKRGRENPSRINLSRDVILNILRTQRRQSLAYIERRYANADVGSDEEEEGDMRILFSDDNDASGDLCNIS